MKLFLFLSLLVSLGCAKPESLDSNGPRNFYSEVREVRQGNAMKGRFFFIHGMGQTIADLKQGEWDRMADFMHAQDFEVVYVGWDFINHSDMSNGGADYVSRFQLWVLNLNSELENQRPAPQIFIGGASMGGWHSIIASEVIQSDAVYASQTVTRLNVLWPFAGHDTSSADLHGRAIPQNLFVTAGTADWTVDWQSCQALYGHLPNYREYIGHVHGPYQDEYDDIMDWLLLQID